MIVNTCTQLMTTTSWVSIDQILSFCIQQYIVYAVNCECEMILLSSLVVILYHDHAISDKNK